MKILKHDLLHFFGIFIKYSLFNLNLNNLISYQEEYFYSLHNKYSSKTLFYNFIYKIISSQDLYLSSFFFLNYSNLYIKNYNILYYLEFLFVNGILFVPRIFFFNRLCLSKVFDFNKNLFKVDSVNFFTLGPYTEYCRRFMYNEYFICNNIPLNNLIIKKHFHKVLTVERMAFLNEYTYNIMSEDYIIYDKQYIISRFNYSPLCISYNLPFIYNNFVVNKFLNFWLFFNSSFFFYIVRLFFNQLRTYTLLENYRIWTSHFWVFKFKVYNIFELYFLLRKLKEDFCYYSIFHLFVCFFVFMDRFFIENNIYYLLFFFSPEFSLFINLDYIIIDYISFLYFRYLDKFFFTRYYKKNLHMKYVWEVLAEWYHFDCVFIPYNYNSMPDLFSWLNYIKYSLEYNIWVSFNIIDINKYNIFDNYFLIYKYSSIDLSKNYLRSFLNETYAYYLFNNFLMNFNIFNFYYIFSFTFDFFFQAIYFSNIKLVDLIDIVHLNINQFKKFYHNINYHQRYLKFHNFYLDNRDEYDEEFEDEYFDDMELLDKEGDDDEDDDIYDSECYYDFGLYKNIVYDIRLNDFNFNFEDEIKQ